MKLRATVSAVAVWKVGSQDQPHASSQGVDVQLQNVMAGAGDWQLKEVQADAPAAARANLQGVQQAGRRQVVWSALTRRHVGQVRTYSSTAARCNVEQVQLLRAKRARGRYAKAIVAPAAEVEQPVAADEGGARRLSCGGVLPLCRRRQGPQNRVRRECRAKRGREVGAQKARPLSRGTSGHEGRSRGRQGCPNRAESRGSASRFAIRSK